MAVNVVFSGAWPQETRNDKSRRYDKRHINVQKGITKKTDVLVIGHSPGRTKMVKADQYNIPIMSEEQFFSWLRENKPEYFL